MAYKTADEIREWILDWMSRKLSIKKTSIDARDSIASYGVDSIMIAEFEGEISEYVGFQWPIMDMMIKDPSIDEICQRGEELGQLQHG
ncbi:MAG: acyl carrier protein [Bacteroidia bacterium]|nr:acyl carrier protein [Bacteroidia bacterium]